MKLRRNAVLIVMVMVILFLGGCSKNEKKTVFYFSDNNYCPQYTVYRDADYEWTKSAKKWKEGEKIINELCTDLCNFLNTEYEAKLDNVVVNIYLSEVSNELQKQTTALQYGALYFNGNIYVDKSLVKAGLNDEVTYVLAHELIHLLCAGKIKFSLKNETGGICGNYWEEAIVDSLARRYMLAKNPDINMTKLTSGYKYIRLCVDLLQIEIPDLFKYFFDNDISGLQEKVDKIAKKYLICKGSSFEKLSSMIDDMTINKEEYLEDRFSAILSFTSVIMSSKNSEKFVERAAEDEFDLQAFVKFMHK